MSSYKLFAQRVGLVGVTNLLLSLSGIILLPVLTKNLPVQDYGIWAQMMVTIGIVPAIAMLGLSYTMVRYLPSLKKKEDIQEIFYSIFFLVFITTIIIALLIYTFSESIASSLFNYNTTIVEILALVVLIESLNSLFLNYFRARQNIKKYSTILIVKTLLQIFCVSFFVLTGKGIIGATIGLLITLSIIFFIMSFIIVSDIGIKIPTFKYIRELLSFGLPTVPGNISNWVINSSDRYVIGLFLGTTFVGYYSPGYSIGNLINVFITPLMLVLPATLSEKYDTNCMEDVECILGNCFKYFFMIGIPAVFGISLLSKNLLIILTTPEIAAQGYLIVPFIAISTLFFGAYSIIRQIIILEKKTKIIGMILIVSSVLNLGLNFVLIPYIGIIGAAITTLLAFTISLIFTSYYSFKFFKFKIDFGFILKSLLSSIVMSLPIIKLDPTGLLEMFITIGISALLYFIMLLLLKGISFNEIHYLKEIINK